MYGTRAPRRLIVNAIRFPVIGVRLIVLLPKRTKGENFLAKRTKQVHYNRQMIKTGPDAWCFHMDSGPLICN